ncbi:large subunit ribosomal protein L9 [Azospirillum agricola]|uniref:50S ribosomal protein L9 n=1 Tax=Azospirillum agricola TaxID=1720247 RepID=UPI001AE7A0AA|nr:50S ribosomal protein L9 [Azospirillum agricola]MBP2227598.1 large subunit ribosomal protein L9 [Azospirillum agricola]
MEVILLERVEKLGQMGQVVNVKPGFARNFLLPQKKAMRATKANMAVFEKQKAHLEAVNLERRKDAQQVATKMDGVTVVVIRQAAETGVLYGSVNNRDIADALDAAGYKTDRKQIVIDTPIKTLGLFKVRVVLHPEVTISVTVNVARSQEESELQAQRGGMVTAADLRDEDEEETYVQETATEDEEA